jgi:Ca2+-binding RTX toxin-like protein
MDFRGTESADVLNGTSGDDVIYGFGGNDTLKGGAGDDVLAGNDGNDILQGGDGDDYLLGGAGNDTIDGGAGNDWAAYEDATAGVKVDLNITGTQNTGGSGTDKLTGIENVYGSAFNDTLTGDAKDNMFVGDAGNDTISGGKGNDTLWGDAGNDVLDGGDGDDYIVGGSGDDIIKGGAGDDWSSYENATAGVTVDLTKTTAQDTVGAGKDTISGVEHLYGSKFDDVLTGDARDNYLWGSDGNDKLYGGAGDDHLSGGNGVNLIDGGAGFDTVDYSFSDVGVDIDLSRNYATSRVGGTINDTLTGLEAAMGSTHDDYLVGNMAENYLFGDAGNDVMWAIGGHDTLDGGDGNDILYGSNLGEGDLMLGGAGDDAIIVCAGEAGKVAATADGGVGVDTLQFNTSLNITFDLKNTGDQLVGTNTHVTARGFENLTGGDGNDHLTGDAGNNVIEGRDGADVLDGDAGGDVASYANALSGVRVDLTKVGVAQDTRGAGVDTLSNFEGLKGSRYADILIGDDKDNTLEGGAGNDLMEGGAGADTAIYKGPSTNFMWIRNANGTWTVTDVTVAEGSDTLLNIETLKFSDRSINLSPSATTVKIDDILNPKIIASSSAGQFIDAVPTADGRIVYISDTSGYVSAIDAVTGETTARWKVGSMLGGMDLSLDGKSLVVAEGLVNQGALNGNPIYTALVYVVDLTNGAVKTYATNVMNSASGFADAAFMSDGKILLTQYGGVDVYVVGPTLDPAAGGTFTELYAHNGTLSVSDDRKTLLVADANNSSGPLGLITVGETEFKHTEFGTGLNFGIQALSGDGSRVARATYDGEIQIFDRALKQIGQITTPHQNYGAVYGLDFNADGSRLFVFEKNSDKILEYSTATGMLERAISLGIDIEPTGNWGDGAEYGDSFRLSDDGQRLIIFSNNKVVSVNLATMAADGGTDHNDVLMGTTGGDHLEGYGGDDVLVGGWGADVLTGGKGTDTFVFGPGDTTWSSTSNASLDIIMDWETGDHLLFKLAGAVSYGEQTAASWTEALTIAPQLMQTQHVTRLAIQVGNDVYVFASEADNAGQIKGVVRLGNTGLDKLDVTNFQWSGSPVTGDDAANILVGTTGDDTISGLGGDDVIVGGFGKDTLTGGAGADVFKFLAGEGVFSRGLTVADIITDFGAGDKLAFAGAPAVVQERDILRMGNVGSITNGKVPAAVQLTIEAYNTQLQTGALGQKYLVVGMDADTYVLADTDNVLGYDQVVLLKNVSSSLVTADVFMAA